MVHCEACLNIWSARKNQFLSSQRTTGSKVPIKYLPKRKCCLLRAFEWIGVKSIFTPGSAYSRGVFGVKSFRKHDTRPACARSKCIMIRLSRRSRTIPGIDFHSRLSGELMHTMFMQCRSPRDLKKLFNIRQFVSFFCLSRNINQINLSFAFFPPEDSQFNLLGLLCMSALGMKGWENSW